MTEQPETCRDYIAGMPLVFNPEAAGGRNAVIYFKVGGEEPGDYTLTLQDSQCTFAEGIPEKANLTIETPSEFWLAISKGEMDGQKALMQGKYKAKGDMGPMIRMGALFTPKTD